MQKTSFSDQSSIVEHIWTRLFIALEQNVDSFVNKIQYIRV